MSVIDERVVSLQFDNKKFENNVGTSLNSLEKIKKATEFKGATAGIETLGTKIKGLTFDPLYAGVSTISSRFTTLGLIGMTAIQNITDKVVELGAKLVTSVPDKILGGGWRRASNIEKARHQIEGLAGSAQMAADIINGPVNNSVADTAYSLDQAAIAASALFTSGIKDLTQLEKVLKAISGTTAASMDGNYEQISQIVTQMQSYGRLTGDFANRLQLQGISIKDMLAETYGKSSEEITKLISQGKISAEQTIDLLYDKFADFAFKANDTFTGAAANINSAFSKIGAEIFGPLISSENKAINLIAVLNHIRVAINNIKKALMPVFAIWNDLVIIGGTWVNNVLAKFEDATPILNFSKHLKNMWDQFKRSNMLNLSKGTLATFRKSLGETAEESKKSVASVKKDIQKLIEYGEAKNESEALELIKTKARESRTIYGDVIETLDALKHTIIGIKDVVFSAGKAIKTVFSGMAPLFTGLFKVLNGFLTIVVNIIDLILGPALMSVFDKISGSFIKIQRFFDPLAKGAERLASMMYAIGHGINLWADGPKLRNFQIFMEKISGPIAKLKEFLGSKLTGARDFLANLFPSEDNHIDTLAERVPLIIDNLFSKLNKAIDKITEIKNNVVAVLKGIKSNIENFLGIELRFPTFDEVTGVFENIKNAIEPLKGMFDSAKDSVVSFFDSFKRDDAEVENKVGLIDRLRDALKKLWDFISPIVTQIGDAFKQLFEGIREAMGGNDKALDVGGFLLALEKILVLMVTAKGLESISAALGDIFGILKSALDHFTAKSISLIKNLGQAILMLAISLFVISSINPERLASGLLGLTVLFGLLITTFNRLKASPKKADEITHPFRELISKISGITTFDTIKLITALGTTMLLLAAAVKVLSSIETDKMAKSIIAIGAMMLMLKLFLQGLSTNEGGFSKAHKGLISFGLLIILLSASLKMISGIEPGALARSVLTVLALGTLMGILIAVLSKNQGGFAKAKKGLLAFGVTMLLLTFAMKSIAKMEPNDIKKGLITIGVLSAIIAALMLIMGKAEHVASSFISLLVLGVAISSLTDSIKKLSDLNGNQIKTSLIALGGGLAIMVASLMLLSLVKPLVAAVSLLVLAAALKSFAGTMTILGSMDWEGIKKAFIVIVGVIGVLALTVGILTLIPGAAVTLLILAAAITSLGIAMLAFGVGVAIFSAGLLVFSVALPAAVMAFVAALYTLSTSILMLIPLAVNAIGALMQAILTVFKNNALVFVDIVVTVGTAVMLAVLKMLPLFVTVVGIVIVTLLDGLAKWAPVIVDSALNLMAVFCVGLADGIRNNTPKILFALGDLLAAIVELALSVLEFLLGKIPGVGDKLAEHIRSAKDEVRDILAPEEMREQAFGSAEAMEEGFASGSSGLVGSAEGVKSNMLSVFVGDEFTGAGGNIISDITGGLDSGTGDLMLLGDFQSESYLEQFTGNDNFGTGDEVSDDVLSGMLSNDEGFNAAGLQEITSYGSGIESGKGDVEGKTNGIVGSIKSILNIDTSGDGENVSLGYAKGINRGADAVNAAASNVANIAMRAMRNIPQISSPSKVTTKYGQYISEGLAIGIKNMAYRVENESEDLAHTTLNAIQNPISKIADLLSSDMDVNPTITPVLDLSQIQNGTNSINSMLSGNRAYTLSGINSNYMNARPGESMADQIASSVGEKLNDALNALQSMNDKSNYTIEVPVVMNGREVAHVSAPFMRNEINILDRNQMRKAGVR